jgi:polyhydroxybutyrate depolymerase
MAKVRLLFHLFGLTALILVLLVPGCSSDGSTRPLKPGTYDLHLTSDGLLRTYRLHVPPGYTGNSPYPLVIVLHGGGGTGIEMESLTGFSALADQENFIVAYPNGYVDHHWADGRGTTQPEIQGVNDVNFISDLITKVCQDANIDSTRVYACGFSNGAIMTNLLGCDLSYRLAAIGGVSGELAENISDHTPSQPLGVIYFHGTDDPVVPYDGGLVLGPNGGRVLSVNETMLFWVEADGSDSTPSMTLLADVDPTDGTRVIHFASLNGSGDTEVHLYRVENGGHTWPDCSLIGKVTHDIDATQLMWDFFKTQHK